MRLVRVLALGVGLAVAGGAAAEEKKADKPAAKLDPAKLAGSYKLTGGTKAGDKAGDDAKKGTVTITKDKIALSDGDMKFEFSYKVDAAATPAAIDMEITEPDALKGTKAKGIVMVKGDELTLAYHPMGGDRPKTFESTKDNGVYLFTLKKSDAKGDPKPEKKGDK